MKTILSLLLVIFSLNVYSQGEWLQLSPWPTINDLFDVYFINAQKGWMVGENGTIVSTSDGGETWNWQYKDESKYFKGVFFIDESEGWVVGWHDVLHTTTGGDYWEEQDLPGFLDVEAVTFINPDTGWIVGTYKTIYKTVDGGETWIEKLSGTPSAPMLNDVYFADALHGVAVGGYWFTQDNEAFIIVTIDGGETWHDYSPEGIEELKSISFISQNTGWACGYGQEVLKTSDGGYTWDIISSFYNIKWDLHFFDQYSGLILATGRVFSTMDGGINWTENFTPGFSSLNSFVFSEFVGFAGGYDGSMCKSTDYGVSWQYTGSEPFPDLESIYFADSLSGWAKNIYSSSLSKTENGGINWEVIDIGASEILSDLYFTTPTNGFALGYHDNIYKTTDAGETWTNINIGMTSDFQCLYFVNNQTGFIGGSEGLILKTIDGGENWTPGYTTYTYGWFKDIGFADEQIGWIIDNTGHVYYTDNGGEDWSLQGLGNPGNLDDIYVIDEQKVFITSLGVYSYVYMTENGGLTWEVVHDISSSFYNRARISFVNDSEGWFFTGFNLYYSINGGHSWSLYDHLSYMTDIYFLDNENGWIFGSNSLMMKYVNLTTNYDEIEPNTLTVSPNPVSNILTVQLSKAYTNHAIINIFDINGRLLINRQVQYNSFKEKIDVTCLKGGLYILEYRTKDQRQTVKFLKHN